MERPPREVLGRAEVYVWRLGFRASLNERTETTALFARTHVPRKGVFRRMLDAPGGATDSVQKVRLLASRAGEGRTRLTIIELRQGELPDEWMNLEDELERGVLEELGGTYWPF